MRYLKVFAQDRFDSGRADSVLLEFHDRGDEGADTLVSRLRVSDSTVVRQVDSEWGDVTCNEREIAVDKGLLESFANVFLSFQWFNPGTSSKQYLKLIADDQRGDGTPDVVRFQQVRETEDGSGDSTIFWSAAFDRDNDGKVDFSFTGDANGDGRVDRIDTRLVQHLAAHYLKFNWS